MKCDVEKIKIHLYHDKQLSEEDSKFLSHHISECESCSKELKYLSLLDKKFTEIPFQKVSQKLLLRLNRIEKKKFNILELFKDIYKISIKNKDKIFHINATLESLLHEKYSEKIIRWVFYC